MIHPNLYHHPHISQFQITKIETVEMHLFLAQSGEDFICKKTTRVSLDGILYHYRESNPNRNSVVNFQSISQRLIYGNGRACRIAFFTHSIELEEKKCYSSAKLSGFNCLQCFTFVIKFFMECG